MTDYAGKQSRSPKAYSAGHEAQVYPGKHTLVEQAYPLTMQQQANASDDPGAAALATSVGVVQRRADRQANEDVHAAAARGLDGPATSMPFADRIQALFGTRYDEDKGGSRSPGRTTTSDAAYRVIQARKRLAGPAELEAPEGPSGGSNALPAPFRERMERSFGADFSDVRVHQCDAASRAGALAFASSSDLHFAPGQYDPASSGGQELIAHELAHVVQQRQGRVSVPQGKGAPVNADPSLEAEADALAARAVRGEIVGSTGSAAGGAVGPWVKQLRKQVRSGSGGQVKWSETWNNWYVMIGPSEAHVSVFPDLQCVQGLSKDSSNPPRLEDIWYDEFHVTISGRHFFFDEDGKFLPGGSSRFSFMFQGKKECSEEAQEMANDFVKGPNVTPPLPRGNGGEGSTSGNVWWEDHSKQDEEEWKKMQQDRPRLLKEEQEEQKRLNHMQRTLQGGRSRGNVTGRKNQLPRYIITRKQKEQKNNEDNDNKQPSIEPEKKKRKVMKPTTTEDNPVITNVKKPPDGDDQGGDHQGGGGSVNMTGGFKLVDYDH